MRTTLPRFVLFGRLRLSPRAISCIVAAASSILGWQVASSLRASWLSTIASAITRHFDYLHGRCSIFKARCISELPVS